MLPLRYPIHLTVVGLRPRANKAQLNVCYIPSVILGAQGQQLPCVTFLAPNVGLEAMQGHIEQMSPLLLKHISI